MLTSFSPNFLTFLMKLNSHKSYFPPMQPIGDPLKFICLNHIFFQISLLAILWSSSRLLRISLRKRRRSRSNCPKRRSWSGRQSWREDQSSRRSRKRTANGKTWVHRCYKMSWGLQNLTHAFKWGLVAQVWKAECIGQIFLICILWLLPLLEL